MEENMIVKRGYLTKSPPQSNSSISFKNWRRKWFVLFDSCRTYPLAPREVRLEYYADERTSERKGAIDLTDVNSVQRSEKEIRGHRHIFNLVTDRRCYHLSADTEDEKNQWVRILHNIVAETRSQPNSPPYGGGGYGADDVLATPKFISSAPDDDFGMTAQQRGNKAAPPRGGAVYSVVQKPFGKPPKGSTSQTYDEEWDSEDETVGPSAVRSNYRASADDRLLFAERKGPDMAAQSFVTPMSVSLSARPVHFGEGVHLEVDDGIPEYQNLGGKSNYNETEDGLNDYSEVGHQEFEDNIHDYSNLGPDGKPIGCDDGLPDYANLGPDGKPLNETDDNIPEYANLDADGKPIGQEPERAIEYIQLDHSQPRPLSKHNPKPSPSAHFPKTAYGFAQPKSHSPLGRALSCDNDYRPETQFAAPVSLHKNPPPPPHGSQHIPQGRIKRDAVPDTKDRRSSSVKDERRNPGSNNSRPQSAISPGHPVPSAPPRVQPRPARRSLKKPDQQLAPSPSRSPVPEFDGNYMIHSRAESAPSSGRPVPATKPRPPIAPKSHVPLRPSEVRSAGQHKPALAPRPTHVS